MYKLKSISEFINEYNKYTGDEVAQHIVNITPDSSDIPDYFIDKFIKPNDGWELKQIKLKDLLKDRDFKDYYNSGEERYDDYEVDPNDLYNDLVVYKGKLLDGYSRATKMLRDGEKTAGAYILEQYLFESESYNDYPEAAVKAAKKALKWREEHGDEVDAGTRVGWERANQLANKENLTIDTIKRMKSFFARHDGNQEINSEHKDEPWKDNGYIMHLAWGGDAAYKWAKEKLKNVE